MATAMVAVKEREVQEKMFLNAEDIVEAMLTINEKYLKQANFTREAIAKLGEPPACPSSDGRHLFCLMLLPESTTVARDFAAYWKAFNAVHGNARKWSLLDELSDRIRPSPEHVPSDGLRWEIVELGRATKGKCVMDAVQEIKKRHCAPLGPELLLIGAVHPRWVKAMDGGEVPFLNASDVVVQLHHHLGNTPFVTQLSRGGEGPKIDVEASDNMNHHFGTGALCATCACPSKN